VNDLGHGLVVFDIFGTLLEIGRIENAQLWNTRWVHHDPETPSLWDAMDDMNQLQPTGKALAIWGQFLGEQMLEASEPKRTRTFATYTPSSKRLAVCMINKDMTAREVTIAPKGLGAGKAQVWRWQGDGPDDRKPVWAGPEGAAVRDGRATVSLPADSLTVVELTA
jgi:hypothetical protein